MNVNTWSELSALKAKLLGIVDVLLHDHVIPNEKIALKLLEEIENLHIIECDLIKSSCNCELRELEKKKTSTDGE
jgi:hypothetical protein